MSGTGASGFRQILPAPSRSLDGYHDSDTGTVDLDPGESQRRAKRQQISVACDACRRRKARCDGERPRCAPCQAKGTDCHYSADPDTSRMETLRRRVQSVEAEKLRLEQFISLLQAGPEVDSYRAYNALRAGHSVDEILEMVRKSLPDGLTARDLIPKGLPGSQDRGPPPFLQHISSSTTDTMSDRMSHSSTGVTGAQRTTDGSQAPNSERSKSPETLRRMPINSLLND